ncbi:MAG TPA: type II toxin-antitoxin system RelE/ParE family toxin [bacterium]|nr:type II toxin-antitoxin system RelE/ParE family toxin [bacterium]
MTYRLAFKRSAAKELAKLDRTVQVIIKEKLELLCADPATLAPNIKRLTGSGLFRLRVADYRVVFTKDDERIVILVVRIGHRKEVYLER